MQNLRAICLFAVSVFLLSTGLSAKAAAPSKPAKKAVLKKSSSRHPAGHSTKSKKVSAKSKKGAWKRHGQQQIANDRTREIQGALIKANYLNGNPSGVMDARTKDALTRYQKDNGWQSKVVPDSRALIKLGLGPDNSNLLNPTTAAMPVYRPGESVAAGNQQ